jgi:hypothetical protein
MRIIVRIAGLIALLFSLVSCSSEETVNETSDTSSVISDSDRIDVSDTDASGDPDEIDLTLEDTETLDMVNTDVTVSDSSNADRVEGDSELSDSNFSELNPDVISIHDITVDEETDPLVDGGGEEISEEVSADAETDIADSAVDEPDVDPVPTFDCATVPDSERTMNALEFPRAHDGITFNAEGVFIGASNPHVMRSYYDDPAELIAPNVGSMYQMDILPDGDYVVQEGDTNTIMRVSPEGSVTTLATDVGGYSLRVFPDGLVYAGASFSTGDADDMIYRIDPDTGDKTTYINSERLQPRGFDLSQDLNRVFIGTADCSGNGRIWVVDVDEEFNPLNEPSVFAVGVGEGWHDGVGVDACGNIWVTEFCSGALWRISADGLEVEKMLEYNPGEGWDFEQYGHAVIWGSGVGGWMDQALYMPQPNNNNNVFEVDIGVPSRSYNGIVLNALDPL